MVSNVYTSIQLLSTEYDRYQFLTILNVITVGGKVVFNIFPVG